MMMFFNEELENKIRKSIQNIYREVDNHGFESPHVRSVVDPLGPGDGDVPADVELKNRPVLIMSPAQLSLVLFSINP